MYLSMSAVGLAATTSIAGIFGMNLVSGIEETPLAFAAVTAGSGLVGATVVGGAVVGMDEGLVVGAVVGAAVTFMSAQTMCPMRLRSTPSNSAR